MRVVAGCVLAAVLLFGAAGAEADDKRGTYGGFAWELVDVHEIKQSHEPGRGKPAGSANCTDDGAATGTYGLTGWTVDAPRTAHYNPATTPGGLLDVPAELQRSYDAWTGVPPIVVATDGTGTRQSPNRGDDLMFGSPGGSIATTYTYRWNDGFIESDVVFNKKLKWFIAPEEGDGCFEETARYDVANIATHEFGHVYGLDHPDGARFETMFAFGYTGETLKRSPAAGDVNGIQAAY